MRSNSGLGSGVKSVVRAFWAFIFIIYWYCAVWILQEVSPIWIDGSGPLATFYWGKNWPTPTLSEYHENKHIRLQFLWPYWIAAAIVTLAGCGVTPWLARRWKVRQSRLFLISAVIDLAALAPVAAISDLGTAFGIWRGPAMLALPALKIAIPLSLLAGGVSVIRFRFRR